MFERTQVGTVSKKHHIALRDANGVLMHEECITQEGFEGPYTIAYHLRPPHTVRVAPVKSAWELPRAVTPQSLAKRHYQSQNLKSSGSMLDSRTPLLFNSDVTLAIAKPTAEDASYCSNNDGDELFYIHAGGGLLRTQFGDLAFTTLDYVYIPRGTIYRFIPTVGVEQHWLCMELKGGLHLPKQWRNPVGQLRMDAPYSARDFRKVQFQGPLDEGLRELVVKRGEAFHGFVYRDSPLDVIGWDGTVYPWVFPILNFQPRAGLVHLPPTWHGTFATRGSLICSFVPRVTDFHPEAIPCPYPHSAIDVDEFLFYCKGNFTSRRGVGPGSISYHPAGIPHGPHPGAYEGSIGHTSTNELAVMLDVLKPLEPTLAAQAIEDSQYHDSFIPSHS